MAINRRTFIQTLALYSSGVLSIPASHATTQTSGDSIIGACRLSGENYGVSCINLLGDIVWQLPIPARGHEVALHPNLPVGVAIARRPERFMVLFNSLTGQKLQTLEVTERLKLNGHAVWRGRELIVSGSDRATSSMQLISLVLSDNNTELTNQSITELNLIGPHQMVLHDDQLWIAAGGLITRGREVINKENVQSALALVNADSKKLEARFSSPDNSLSLRHLSLSPGGEVFISGQYQLNSDQSPALLFKLENSTLKPFAMPDDFWPKIDGYIGSIACTENTVVATSPRGHWLGEFDQQTLKLRHQMLSRDICAVTDSPIGPIAGTGTGHIHLQDSRIRTTVRWDNHFSYLKQINQV
jgi:hypothetical protein